MNVRGSGWIALKLCAVVLVLVTGAVGCGTDEDESASPEKEALGNCAPLIDEIMSAYQARIDEFEDREVDELTRDDFSSEANEELTEEQRSLNRRAKDLQCNPKDVLLIVADRGDELIASTPAAAVAKAQLLSGASNALFYGPDNSAEFGEATFTPQPVEPENDIGTEDAEAIEFETLTTCPDLVEAQLILQQVTLNEMDQTPFREALTGGGSYSLDKGGFRARFQQALDRSKCSRRDFAYDYLTRAESLEARGALANLSKASFIEDQWDAFSEDSEISIAVSVTTAKSSVEPGETVELLVTIENDGSASLNEVVLRETDESGSTDATTVGLPPLTTGALAPGHKERFTVSFEVPHDASGQIQVEYDTAKGTGDGGSGFTSSGTGVILMVRS